MSHYTPTPDQLQALLQYAGKRLGMTPEQLISTVQNGGVSSLEKNMSPADAKKLHAFIGDKQKADQFLQSPQVQQMIAKFLNSKQ